MSASAEQQYRVVLCGVVEGRDVTAVAEQLASTFGVDASKLARALQSGKDTPVKRDIDRQTANTYVDAIERAGARCRMEPMPTSQPGQLPSGASAQVKTPLPQGAIRTPPPQPVSLRTPQPQPASAASRPEPAPSTATSIAGGISLSTPQLTPQQRDWEAYVGENADYYLEQFDQLSVGGEPVLKPTWNWAACLVPVPWAVYRKLYLWALILVLFGVPVLGNVLMGMFGNYLYFRLVHERVSYLRSRSPTSDLGVVFAREGGVNGWVVPVGKIVGIGLGVLMLLGMLSAMIIPLCVRPQNVEKDSRGSEEQPVMAQARQAQTRSRMNMIRSAVMAKMAEDGRPPKSIDDLGLGKGQGRDAWGTKFELETTGAAITLRSAGEDRTMYTDDDITMEVDQPFR